MRSAPTGTQTPIAAFAPVDKPVEDASLVAIPVSDVGDALGDFGGLDEDAADEVERAIFHPCIAEATI